MMLRSAVVPIAGCSILGLESTLRLESFAEHALLAGLVEI